jgi:hypothetical protein
LDYNHACGEIIQSFIPLYFGAQYSHRRIALLLQAVCNLGHFCCIASGRIYTALEPHEPCPKLIAFRIQFLDPILKFNYLLGKSASRVVCRFLNAHFVSSAPSATRASA